MMGAFFWSAIKHECSNQPSDTVKEEQVLEEVNTAEFHTEPGDASPALMESNEEAATAIPEEAEATKEAIMAAMADIREAAITDMANIQETAMADIQKAAMAAMADIQEKVDQIMEQLLASRGAAGL